MTNTAAASVAAVLETNVAKLAPHCHVVEVKAPYALVHASPTGLAAIVALGLSVSPSKRGGEYYAVRVAPSAPTPGKPANDNAAPVALAPTPRPAPVAKPAPATLGTPSSMNIKGDRYEVTETATKRRVDVRRWELSKGDGKAPYVVTFQTHGGESTACSCKGGIFHKHCKHMDALRAAFGARSAVA